MRAAAALFAALALAGCADNPMVMRYREAKAQEAAEQAAADVTECKGYGFQAPDAIAQCRMGLEDRRQARTDRITDDLMGKRR